MCGEKFYKEAGRNYHEMNVCFRKKGVQVVERKKWNCRWCAADFFLEETRDTYERKYCTLIKKMKHDDKTEGEDEGESQEIEDPVVQEDYVKTEEEAEEKEDPVIQEDDDKTEEESEEIEHPVVPEEENKTLGGGQITITADVHATLFTPVYSEEDSKTDVEIAQIISAFESRTLEQNLEKEGRSKYCL